MRAQQQLGVRHPFGPRHRDPARRVPSNKVHLRTEWAPVNTSARHRRIRFVRIETGHLMRLLLSLHLHSDRIELGHIARVCRDEQPVEAIAA